jgi:hypothetical protein
MLLNIDLFKDDGDGSPCSDVWQNWSLNRSDKRKIEAAEMRILRPTTGYTLLDKKKRSIDIREQLGIFTINKI